MRGGGSSPAPQLVIAVDPTVGALLFTGHAVHGSKTPAVAVRNVFIAHAEQESEDPPAAEKNPALRTGGTGRGQKPKKVRLWGWALAVNLPQSVVGANVMRMASRVCARTSAHLHWHEIWFGVAAFEGQAWHAEDAMTGAMVFPVHAVQLVPSTEAKPTAHGLHMPPVLRGKRQQASPVQSTARYTCGRRRKEEQSGILHVLAQSLRAYCRSWDTWRVAWVTSGREDTDQSASTLLQAP